MVFQPRYFSGLVRSSVVTVVGKLCMAGWIVYACIYVWTRMDNVCMYVCTYEVTKEVYITEKDHSLGGGGTQLQRESGGAALSTSQKGKKKRKMNSKATAQNKEK